MLVAERPGRPATTSPRAPTGWDDVRRSVAAWWPARVADDDRRAGAARCAQAAGSSPTRRRAAAAAGAIVLTGRGVEQHTRRHRHRHRGDQPRARARAARAGPAPATAASPARATARAAASTGRRPTSCPATGASRTRPPGRTSPSVWGVDPGVPAGQGRARGRAARQARRRGAGAVRARQQPGGQRARRDRRTPAAGGARPARRLRRRAERDRRARRRRAAGDPVGRGGGHDDQPRGPGAAPPAAPSTPPGEVRSELRRAGRPRRAARLPGALRHRRRREVFDELGPGQRRRRRRLLRARATTGSTPGEAAALAVPGRATTPAPRGCSLDRFAHPDGRARMVAGRGRRPGRRPARRTRRVYLVTGRVLAQYQSGAQTRRVPRPEPRRAGGRSSSCTRSWRPRLGVEDGRRRRASRPPAARPPHRRGSAATIRPDTVFMPFHWAGDGLGQRASPTTPPTRSRGCRSSRSARSPSPAPTTTWMERGRHEPARQVVVVGAGMVGHRFVDELVRARPRPAGSTCTWSGPRSTSRTTGSCSPRCSPAAATSRRSTLPRPDPSGSRSGAGSAAAAVDREAGEVVLDDGDRARLRPPGAGHRRARVRPADRRACAGRRRRGTCTCCAPSTTAATIARTALNARHAVVLGGGVLGLEAACGLRRRGLAVTVVHLDRPPDGRPARPGPGRGARRTRSTTSGSRVHTSTRRRRGDRRVRRARRRAAHRRLGARRPTCCSCRAASGPRPDLAPRRRPAGRARRRRRRRPRAAPRTRAVHAIGDCAQPPEGGTGLVGPGLGPGRAAGAADARPATRSTAGDRRRRAVPAVRLKAAGVDLVTMGVRGRGRRRRPGGHPQRPGRRAGTSRSSSGGDRLVGGHLRRRPGRLGASLAVASTGGTPLPARPAGAAAARAAPDATPTASPTLMPGATHRLPVQRRHQERHRRRLGGRRHTRRGDRRGDPRDHRLRRLPRGRVRPRRLAARQRPGGCEQSSQPVRDTAVSTVLRPRNTTRLATKSRLPRLPPWTSAPAPAGGSSWSAAAWSRTGSSRRCADRDVDGAWQVDVFAEESRAAVRPGRADLVLLRPRPRGPAARRPRAVAARRRPAAHQQPRSSAIDTERRAGARPRPGLRLRRAGAGHRLVRVRAAGPGRRPARLLRLPHRRRRRRAAGLGRRPRRELDAAGARCRRRRRAARPGGGRCAARRWASRPPSSSSRRG